MCGETAQRCLCHIVFVSDFDAFVKRSAIQKKKKKGGGGVTSCLHASSGRRAALICKHVTQREDMEGGGVGKRGGGGAAEAFESCTPNSRLHMKGARETKRTRL